MTINTFNNYEDITRDRASAYAKVKAEELPDAMQVEDRFRLHQNLLEAIKNLNHELPATIKVPHNDELEENCKTEKIEYSCAGVPLFRRNGYRQSGGRKPLFPEQ